MISWFRVFAFCFVLVPALAFSQEGGEVLIDFPWQVESKAKSVYAAKSVLELPFYDDFSRGLSYPVQSLWDGKYVHVSTKYAVNPPNVGVATFDAIDDVGQLHGNASVFQFSSDTLTSKNINLNFQGDTTIYISFQFQPQGFGYQPSSKDSLVLEFYNSTDDVWEGAWAAWVDFESKTLYQTEKLRNKQDTITSDTLSRTFFKVHFPILPERFKNDGFRFRFRNIASVSSNTAAPGLRGNSDHWHIDMVHIARDMTYKDTLTNDIAFSKPLGTILNNYEQIPWSHFNAQAMEAELTNPLSFDITYTNLGEIPWNITRLFSVYNHSNSNTYSFSGGAENIYKLETINYSRLYLYDFVSNWTDSAKFTFSSHLVTDINPDTYHLRWNDTLRYTQTFKNVYAYDDGSAESGYGLYGEGTQNGRVAYRFQTYEPDNLVGVYIHFNRTFNDANEKYFKLVVWDDSNGSPGNIIYEQQGVKPLFTDAMNKSTLFELSEELWIEAGVFYVGWIQTTTDMLNVGFDRNNNSRSNLFYNITGNWQNSKYDGALMIRPVFGKLTETPTSLPPIQNDRQVKVYPNPASNVLNISLPSTYSNAVVSIFSIAGQMVYSERFTGNSMDISRLANGSYIVRVVANGQVVGTQKLVVLKW